MRHLANRDLPMADCRYQTCGCPSMSSMFHKICPITEIILDKSKMLNKMKVSNRLQRIAFSE